MADPLASARLKLRWAQHHYEALYTATKDFLESDFYEIHGKPDRQKRLVLRFSEVDPPPEIWSVLIGDCVHNLRGTLDHIAWAICHPSTEREEKNVQFPLARTHRAFVDQRHLTPGVARGVRSALESMQPYHRRKWPDTLVLAQLRELSNRDKHRELLTTTAVMENSRLRITIRGQTSVRRQITYRGRVEVGAVVARLEMGYSEKDAEMDVDPELALIEVFDRSAPKEVRGLPVRRTLAGIGKFIEEEVFPRLERFA